MRWPTVLIVFCGTRKLAEGWTYRYLAAAYAWRLDDAAVRDRMDAATHPPVGD